MTLEHQEKLRNAILTLLGLTHAPRRKVHRVDITKNYTVRNTVRSLIDAAEVARMSIFI